MQAGKEADKQIRTERQTATLFHTIDDKTQTCSRIYFRREHRPAQEAIEKEAVIQEGRTQTDRQTDR